jgi:hypothetical protein
MRYGFTKLNFVKPHQDEDVRLRGRQRREHHARLLPPAEVLDRRQVRRGLQPAL